MLTREASIFSAFPHNNNSHVAHDVWVYGRLFNCSNVVTILLLPPGPARWPGWTQDIAPLCMGGVFSGGFVGVCVRRHGICVHAD